MVLRILLPLVLCWALLQASPAVAGGQAVQATIARIQTPVAVLDDVRVRLSWPQGAPHGQVQISAGQAHAPDLGYRFAQLSWRCTLAPVQADGGWQCAGPVRAGQGPSAHLAVTLDQADLDVRLVQGPARVSLQRRGATPDHTRVLLTRVPLAWAQALAEQGWSALRLGSGELAGTVDIAAPSTGAMTIDADLALREAGFETRDGAAAGEQLQARWRLRYASAGEALQLGLRGSVQSGALLVGGAFVDLPAAPVAVALDVARPHARAPWDVHHMRWHDGAALQAQGNAVLAPDGALSRLAVTLRSDDAAQLPTRYLSAWLSLVGLRDLTMRGALGMSLGLHEGNLREVDLQLHGLDLRAPDGRFTFEGLQGDVRLAPGASASSQVRWRGGGLGGLRFGAAQMPLISGDGQIGLRTPVDVAVLGGTLRLDALALRPPADGRGLRVGMGLALEGVEVEQLARAFGWPAFGGTLSGEIPSLRYEDERLTFDGGLSVRVFDGQVTVSDLSMERPFGVAPTLSADFALQELDLYAITGVFDIGDISGRLSGRIDGLRLVDWQLSSFDAHLYTVPRAGVRQRISQRAVRNIGSVGGGGFGAGLQGQLIGFFDDFGYRAIGLRCRLANQVCRMGGLHSAGDAFTIVQGAGVPRLQVIGHNRNVDWPTLVDRVGAAIEGDVAPVVD